MIAYARKRSLLRPTIRNAIWSSLGGSALVASAASFVAGGAPPSRIVDVGPTEAPGARSGATVSTFDELRSAVERPDGPNHITLAAGVFHGNLVIRRSVRIDGSKATVLEGTGEGTVITVHASNVGLDNFAVRHSGRRHTTEDAAIKATGQNVTISRVVVEDSLFGVSLLECHECLVEKVHVRGDGDESELRGDGLKLWESDGSTVRGCLVDDARDVVVWYTKRATIEANVVRRSRYGAHFMYAHDAVVRGNRFESNVVGVFVMYSLRLRVEHNALLAAQGAAGIGLGFKDSDAVDVQGNWMVANTVGVYLDNTPRTPDAPVNIGKNVLALNEVALRLHGPGAGVHLHENEVANNAMVVEVDGGGSARAIEAAGNHFSDYEGYDLDGDGVGDVPYQVKALSSELTGKLPALKVFNGSAALGTIDAVARSAPILATNLLFMDARPSFHAIEVQPL
jgi:nitrous oxidase accessory protein